MGSERPSRRSMRSMTCTLTASSACSRLIEGVSRAAVCSRLISCTRPPAVGMNRLPLARTWCAAYLLRNAAIVDATWCAGT
jgi:hypothetical protein